MATELGQAYVQIMPSAKGIKSIIEKELGMEVPSAGKTAGVGLGKSIVGGLASVLAAAGIGKMISSALSAGADLQQSFGGIDTLYKGLRLLSKGLLKRHTKLVYQQILMQSKRYLWVHLLNNPLEEMLLRLPRLLTWQSWTWLTTLLRWVPILHQFKWLIRDLLNKTTPCLIT